MSSKSGKELMEALKKNLETLWASKFHNTGGTHDVYNGNESRAEHEFYHEFQKWSHAGIVSQYPVIQYRLDFLVYWKERGIGVEIDGAKYHNVKKDKIRDIRILHGSEIDAIVRFNASDAIYNPSFCVYFLQKMFPWVMKGGPDPDRLLRKMEHHGIYKIEKPKEGKFYGYKTYDFLVHFMTADKRIQYLNDDEEYSFSEDFNPELAPDIMDYCYQKIIQVKVMTRTDEGSPF